MAQRQAALREMMAAGARSTPFVIPCVPARYWAPSVPRKTFSGNWTLLALDQAILKIYFGPKAGEPSHFWLGSRFGGKHWRVARKVDGAAAGGAQGNWRRGTVNAFVYSVRAGSVIEHTLCHNFRIDWTNEVIGSGRRRTTVHFDRKRL